MQHGRPAVASRPRASLGKGVAMLFVGAVLALLLPGFVPDTPGSPATLVMLLMLWILGGALALLGLAVALVALLRRDHGDGDLT